jgi:hypothetical protein
MKRVIRNLILFLCIAGLLPGITTAQEKYMTNDFGYTSQVKQVEEVKYEYSEKDKQYRITRQRKLSFDKGRLVSFTEGEILLMKYSETNINYTYDANGNLKTSVEENNDGKKESFSFSYKNGKLVSKIATGDTPMLEELYEYTNNGLLSKITLKNRNGIIKTVEYTAYKGDKTYTLTEHTYFKGKETSASVSNYLNGQMVSASLKFAFADKPSVYTYKYDSKGNRVEEVSGNVTYRNVYNYDDRENPFQIKFGGREGGDASTPNSFLFAKITYTDGLTLGTADLVEFFVKQYDKKSASYSYQKKIQSSGNDALSNLMAAIENMDDDIKYGVLKTAEGKFKVKAGDEYITLAVKAAKAPNDVDLVLYDTIMEITMVAKDFYTSATPVDQWIEPLLLPYSDANAYFVMSRNGASVSLMVEGRYLNLKEYELLKINNGKDLQVKKEGKVYYLLKDCYAKPDHRFYSADVPKESN